MTSDKIESQVLQLGFQRNTTGVLNYLTKLKLQEDQRKLYENELTLAFWFACHLEDLDTAQVLVNEEYFLKLIVATAFLQSDNSESNPVFEAVHTDLLKGIYN